MPRKLSYIFPAANDTDICKLQDIGGAGALTLNGNLVDPVNHTIPFINYGYSRQVSLSSVNNLSAVAFVITGIQNGVTISETMPGGPNNNSIYTTQVYDVVTSITTNSDVEGIKVGTGWKGFFKFIPITWWPTVINYTLSITPLVEANIADIAVYGTLENILNNGKTFFDNLPPNNPAVFTIQAMGAHAPYIYSNTASITESFLLVQIGDDAVESLNAAMKLIFTQQQ